MPKAKNMTWLNIWAPNKKPQKLPGFSALIIRSTSLNHKPKHSGKANEPIPEIWVIGMMASWMWFLQDLQGGACHVAERHHWNHGLVLLGKLATTFTAYQLRAHLVDSHVCFWQVLQGKGTVKVWLHLFKPMAMVCKAIFMAWSWGDTDLTHCHQSPRASTWGTICTKHSAWTCLLAYVAHL